MFCKKILALILAAAMLAMAISGCTITLITNDGDDSGETGEATGEIGTGIESETSGSIANGETTAETEATTEEIAFEIELPDIEWEDYVPTNFGDATFTLDENRSTSSEYSPDGEAAITLSATDAAGLVWTLEIPAGSYYKAAEITMTPMTNVSVGGLGSLPGGVQLSPDGAVFSTPAKLTVSGPGIDDSIGMFQSGHDGSDVGYAEYENNGDSVTAYLRHFSSAYPGSKPPSDESRAAANTALAAASSYLSSRARLPSKDRYIESFYCPEAFNRPHRVNYNSHEEMYAETEALAYKYLHEEFLEPEITLIKELKAGINNIYAIEDPQSQQYAQTINALFSTLIDKYWELLMSYDEWSWRIVAVVTEFFYGFRHEIDQRIEEYKVSSLTEVQFMELLMATRNRTEMPSWWEGWIRHIANLWQEISEKDARILSDLFTVAERWAEETWNNHMGRLAEGHDFCIPHSLEEIAKYNRKAQVHYNYEDMITRALGFELEITIDLTDYYNRTDDMGVTSISAGGEAVGFFLEKNDAAGGIGYMQKGGKGTGHEPTIDGTVPQAFYWYDGDSYKFQPVLDYISRRWVSSGEDDVGNYEFGVALYEISPECVNDGSSPKHLKLGLYVDFGNCLPKDMPIVYEADARPDVEDNGNLPLRCPIGEFITWNVFDEHYEMVQDIGPYLVFEVELMGSSGEEFYHIESNDKDFVVDWWMYVRHIPMYAAGDGNGFQYMPGGFDESKIPSYLLTTNYRG